MPRPKETERKDIKKLVLDKSRELFLKYGFDNVTMRSIAEHIGYSPAAIYIYYKNKSEIIFELYNIGFKMLYDRQVKISQFQYADPIIKLKAHGIEYVRFGIENPEYYDLMFIQNEPQKFMQECHEIMEKYTNYGMLSFDQLRQNIIECQQAGYFQGHEINSMAFAIWATVHGMVALILRKRIPVPDEHFQSLLESALQFMNSLFEKGK